MALSPLPFLDVRGESLAVSRYQYGTKNNQKSSLSYLFFARDWNDWLLQYWVFPITTAPVLFISAPPSFDISQRWLWVTTAGGTYYLKTTAVITTILPCCMLHMWPSGQTAKHTYIQIYIQTYTYMHTDRQTNRAGIAQATTTAAAAVGLNRSCF